MNKAYLKIYLNNNLGDDLFAKILCDRYPKVKFYTFVQNNLKYKFKNIKVYNGVFYRGYSKILSILTKNRVSLFQILSKKYQIGIAIGGSLFIENKSDYKEEMKNCKHSLILGSNFGPYKESNYPKKFYELFKKSECISFRDKYSYDLFKNIGDNIQYAPDIVFGFDTSNFEIHENNEVIFSIIDCKRKIDEKYQEEYDKKIIELTQYFINMDYKITYMSFCKNEGDEEAINRILSKIENKEKIKTYFYKNNLDEALKILASSKIIVGSRFHANILGLVFNKTIIPVSYSDKTVNALKDINFKGKCIDIRKLDDFKVNELLQDDLIYKLDISKYRDEAQKHFYKLDKLLKQ